MKKLMFIAAAALAGSLFADEITSANIVGYQEIDLPTGYVLYAATFKDVANTDAFNINNIQIMNEDGTAYTTVNKIILQKMDSAGAYLTTYNYRQTKGGWCNKATLVSDVTLANGEAVCLNNNSGAAKKIRVSGQVELTPASYTLGAGYSLLGNMTPNTINMNDISVYYKPDAASDWVIYPTVNKVILQKMDTTGAYLTTYNYRSGKGGWCSKATLVSDVTFTPGEAFCLNNNSGYEIQIRFKSPVAE